MADDKAKKVETEAEKKLRRELKAEADRKDREIQGGLPQIRARARAKGDRDKKLHGKKRGDKSK